jgi:PAS domain S-box-containing protein
MLPLVPEDKLEEYHALRMRSAAGEPFMSRELERQTKSGERIVCSISTAPILDAEGKVIAIMGAAEDVSVRKYAENALRESEERFRRIVDHAPDPIFLETGGTFRFVNDKALELLGATSEEQLLGEPVLNIVDPHYQRVGEVRLRQLNERKRAVGPLVEKYRRLDGETVWVEVTAQPIEFGGEAGALFFVRDISLRLAAEKERESLRSQLQQSQKLEAIGRLAGGVAHDFNNLLSVILGNSELIQKELPPESPLIEPIEEIGHAGERAAALTKHLLAFSRKQHLEVHTVDLSSVVRGFERLLRRVLGEDISLELELAPDEVPVEADVSQLEQVILNLAVNARDAMPDGGRLRIQTDVFDAGQAAAEESRKLPSGLYARLAMIDNGPGMDEKIMAMIFEPFYTTKEAGKGTGLGLSTSYGIVKQHRGHILVSSKPGEGARFEIYLPLLEDAKGKTESEQQQAHASPESSSSTVLVVEDDPAVRKLAVKILEKGGHRPLASSNVQEAIALANQLGEDLDLVLTDVIMPGMKGPDVFAAIHELCPRARVLYMSGYTDNVIEREGLGDDVVNFIQKPFSVSQLLGKVAEVLG